MADVLTGTPSNVTTPLSAAISGTAAGSGGTIVTTSSPHLFGNGDSVFIKFAGGVFAGVFTISVIDSTHFLANGLTYSGSSLIGQAVDLSLTPQIRVPTDGDTFSQQLSGALSSIQGILDRTQYLQREILSVQAQAQTPGASAAVANWHTPNGNIANVAGSGDTAVLLTSCWDSYYSQWLVGGTISNAATTYGSYDGGKTWQSPPKSGLGRRWNTADETPLAADINPDTGTAAFWSVNGSGDVSVNRAPPGSLSTVTAQPFANDCIFGACRFFLAANAFYFVGLNFTTGAAVAATSADGAGLWTNETSSLPSSWNAGSSFTTPRAVISDVGYTAMVVAVCGQTPGSSTSKLLSILPTGVMADITPTFLGGTAKQITGVAFSPSSTLWGVLCNDAANSYLYASQDLATWSLIHTFTGYLSGGLAVVTTPATNQPLASIWVACLGGVNAGGPDENTRIAYSSNVEKAFAASVDTGYWAAADYSDIYGLSPANLGAISQGLLVSSQQQILRLQTGGGTPANSFPGISGGTVAISDRAISPGVPLGVF